MHFDQKLNFFEKNFFITHSVSQIFQKFFGFFRIIERVREPGPGPISMTLQSVNVPADLTIRFVKF